MYRINYLKDGVPHEYEYHSDNLEEANAVGRELIRDQVADSYWVELNIPD